MWGQLRRATILGGLFAASLALAEGAAAESKGIYFDFHAGAVYVQEADNEAKSGGGKAETSYDPGYSLGIALGYDFGDFRLEGELSTREADLDEIDDAFLGEFNAGGNVFASAGMVNAYYDFDTGTPWRPYLGGGIGGAVVGFEDADTEAAGNFADDDDLVFAFQAAAGLGYEFNDNFTFYGGYRFFGTTPPDLETNDDLKTDFESEFFSHTVEVGIRYVF